MSSATPTTPRRTAGVMATAALAGAALALTGVSPAVAAPAPETIAFTGAPASTVVPTGVCAVTINAVGGGGGNTFGFAAGLNGAGAAGANITATYKVRPGMAVDAIVGGGGQMSHTGNAVPVFGGYPDGGEGGTTPDGRHRGAGGGGSTSVSIGGLELIVAGAGGGLGGGHSYTAVGGDAGLPTAAGVTAGGDGVGDLGSETDPTHASGGGQGGQTTAGGAGGIYTAPSLSQGERDALAGFPGVGRQAGNGGNDQNLDSGGGGGGGFFGGGGGSSTFEQRDASGPAHNEHDVAGGGGGGGASFVSPDSPDSLGAVTNISSVAGARANARQAGPNGQVTLTWLDCGLLTNDGSTSDVKEAIQRWTPAPTSEATGAAEAATYELLDGSGNPVAELIVAGGVYTVDGSELVFTPDAGFVGTPPAASYRATGAPGTATGLYTPTVVDPAAETVAADGTPATLAVTGLEDGVSAALGALTLFTAGAAALLFARRKGLRP